MALRADESAVLEAVDEGSWGLIIHCLGTVVDRGLFGSTHDILTLLEAEVFPKPSIAVSGQTLSGAASGDTRHP